MIATAVFVSALVALAAVLVGLVRVHLGPTGADRIIAAQLLGTAACAAALILARALGMPALSDLALILVALSAVTATVYSRRGGSPR